MDIDEVLLSALEFILPLVVDHLEKRFLKLQEERRIKRKLLR